MKKLFFTWIALLTSVYSIQAQIYSNDETHPFDDATFNIGTGIFIPQGKLSTYFATAPMLELSGNFPLPRKRAIELALQIIIPSQKEDFLYLRTIDTIQVKSNMMANIMVNFKKTVMTSAKSELNLKLGIGGSAIQTDARNPFYSGEEGQQKYEYVSAVLISPGLDLRYYFNHNTRITFGISLQYAPYKVEGALREDIGGFGLAPKISYTF